MSLFAKHVSVSRAARVAVSLRSEEIDPLNGVTVNDEVETTVDDGPEVDEGEDTFAEQRMRLNRQHGMIRNRMRAEDSAEAEEEADGGEAAPAEVDAAPEDAVVVDDEAALTVTGEEEAPVEDAEAGEAEPEVDAEPVVDVDAEDQVELVGEAEEEADVVEDASADDEVLGDIEDDTDEVAALSAEMSMLSDSMVAIESFGINPTAVAILQTTGLLDGTALESLGLESFGFESPKAAESQMALEALSDKVKEKAAAWGAKILSVSKSIGSKVMGVLNTVWTKISGAVKALSSASWDAVKSAGRTVKAHPYKTIAATVVAIAAVAGVVAYAGASMPVLGTKAAAFQSFLKSVADKVSKIDFPWSKAKATVDQGGTKLLLSFQPLASEPVTDAAAKLGWTQTTVKVIGGQMNRAWSAVKTGSAQFSARAVKIGNTAVSTASAGAVGGAAGAAAGIAAVGIAGASKSLPAAAFFLGFATVLGAVAKLMIKLISFGFRMILRTLNALVGLVKPKAAVAA